MPPEPRPMVPKWQECHNDPLLQREIEAWMPRLQVRASGAYSAAPIR